MSWCLVRCPEKLYFHQAKKSAIILEEDLEADGVVLGSVDCHNSAISSKCTNDSEEPCQEGNICIGQNADVSKCDDNDDDDNDDSAGEPECLQKDDDDQYDETSGVNDGFRNPDGDMDCCNDGDGEFPNVIMDADGEHEAAGDVHVIDADGVFHNDIEDVHSLIHISGCEDDEGVATEVDDLVMKKRWIHILMVRC